MHCTFIPTVPKAWDFQVWANWSYFLPVSHRLAISKYFAFYMSRAYRKLMSPDLYALQVGLKTPAPCQSDFNADDPTPVHIKNEGRGCLCYWPYPWGKSNRNRLIVFGAVICICLSVKNACDCVAQGINPHCILSYNTILLCQTIGFKGSIKGASL